MLRVFFIRAVAICFFVILFTSCATTPTRVKTEGKVERYTPGVWHRVKRGQTLWRISKTYQVSLELLKEVNDIEDTKNISEGTWIFIPGATRELFVQGGIPVEEQTEVQEFGWPVRQKYEILRYFGKQSADFNFGIDLEVSPGSNVFASKDGVVVLAKNLRGYGNTIIIDHGNEFCTLYARGIKVLVSEGDRVDSNTVIAKVNNNGSSKNIVHYELFYKGKPVNPLYYLP